MIGIAAREMADSLKRLWKDGFGDDEAYINMFFEGCFWQSMTVCYFLDGIPVSAAYLIPACLVDEKGRREQVYYLYAAATLQNYRKKGYFGQILKWIKSSIKEKVLLVPENSALAKYYEKNGFQIWQEERTIRLSAQKSDRVYYFEAMDADEYYEKRNCHFAQKRFVQWNMPMLRYILRENEFCGGFCGKIITEEGEMDVLFRRDGDELQFLELLGTYGEENRADYISSFAWDSGCRVAKVCIAPVVMVNGGLSKGYFNLTMG